MKKLFCLVFAFVLVLSMSSIAFAKEVADDTAVWEEISFEEAVARKMQYDNISYEAAKEELLAKEERIMLQLGINNVTSRNNAVRSNIIQYYNYQKTFVYAANSNYSCEMNATILTFLDHGTTRYIDEVMSVTTKRGSGTASYSWIEQATWSNISYDKRSVVLGATGYYQVTTTTSSTVELPGFDIGGSVGNEITYITDSQYLEATYYAP